MDFTPVRVDATHIRIDFAAPVLYVPAVTWPGSYRLSPSLTVIAVTPGTITEGVDYDTLESVTLTTAEESPTEYAVTLLGIENA